MTLVRSLLREEDVQKQLSRSKFQLCVFYIEGLFKFLEKNGADLENLNVIYDGMTEVESLDRRWAMKNIRGK
jgi:hypothetical protein